MGLPWCFDNEVVDKSGDCIELFIKWVRISEGISIIICIIGIKFASEPVPCCSASSWMLWGVAGDSVGGVHDVAVGLSCI
jgi:hypothetical protein